MRILHILNSHNYSGAENVACQIINLISENSKYDMAYCSPDGQIRTALKNKGIKFIPLKTMSASAIKDVIKQFKPDVIHAHDMRASCFSVLASGKIPVVSHIHINNIDANRLSMRSIVYLLASKRIKYIFWVSNSAFNDYIFKKCVSKKSEILSNVISVDDVVLKKNHAEITEHFDVVYVGRLAAQKDPKRLIAVLNEAMEQKKFSVAIIGNGELEDSVFNEVRRYGLENDISLLGFMDNPFGIVANSQIMLMTSVNEGLPMCALEAQALGVPVISTETDGLVEIIKNGYNGFLSNDNHVLAQKIVEILSDNVLQQELSANSKRSALSHNNLQIYRDRICEVYEMLM